MLSLLVQLSLHKWPALWDVGFRIRVSDRDYSGSCLLSYIPVLLLMLFVAWLRVHDTTCHGASELSAYEFGCWAKGGTCMLLVHVSRSVSETNVLEPSLSG